MSINRNPWLIIALLCCFITPMVAVANPFSTGDIEAGKQLATACAACHEADGNSSNQIWPKIAGLDPDYALRQLYAFKQGTDGCRPEPVMQSMLAQYSDADLLNIVAYYASKAMTQGTAEPEILTLGEQLYRGGDRHRGIPACIACHGPRGRGLASGSTPHLAGQHAVYTAKQLQAYRDNTRCTDPNAMMRGITAKLTDEDIMAVANYIQGLY